MRDVLNGIVINDIERSWKMKQSENFLMFIAMWLCIFCDND